MPRLKPAKRPVRKVFAAFLIMAAVVIAGARVLRSAVHGHGHWHEMARTLYHHYKDWKNHTAYAASSPPERADAPLVVFDGHLGDHWDDWSWVTHVLAADAPQHRGKSVILMTPEGDKGVYLHHDSFSVGGYGTLQVFIQGQIAVNICLYDGGGKPLPPVSLRRYAKPEGAGGWYRAQIPLTALGISKEGGWISGIVFQGARAAALPKVALADIALLPDMALPLAPTHVTVAITIDMAADRRPISPYVYGMAFAPDDEVADLRMPLNRWGGNDRSRYNWVQGNATNAARDWRFANKPLSDGNGPSSAADRFVVGDRKAGADTLLTVPTLGWVASDTDNGHASENVPGDGGPPLQNADGPIAGYDPTQNRLRTSVRSVARKSAPFTLMPTMAGGVVYQDEWINHLVKTFGRAGEGGVKFYSMDNEPDLWSFTHTDVHPARMGYDDLLNEFIEYSTAVKAVDPTAQITGPVSWGWTGYQYSPLDQGDDKYHTHADRAKHGDMPFLAWFLRQVHTHDVKTGQRTLDVLDIHFYPQGDGLFSGHLDKDAQARRLRATRSLWDSTYVDESWIGEPVNLIPRMKGWIAANYPGTKLGITEWNFGADGDINGALAVADTLGIYGRDGVYLANYWAFPPKDSPTNLAFKLYRNADNDGHGFGDQTARAVSADSSRVSCFAAMDTSTGDVTLMLINKMPKATVTAPLALHGLRPARIKSWRVSADNPHKIVALPAVSTDGRALTETLPPYSITLLRIREGGTN